MYGSFFKTLNQFIDTVTQHIASLTPPPSSPNQDLSPFLLPQNRLFSENRKGQATSTTSQAPWSRVSGTTQSLLRGWAVGVQTQPGRDIQFLRTDSLQLLGPELLFSLDQFCFAQILGLYLGCFHLLASMHNMNIGIQISVGVPAFYFSVVYPEVELVD